MECTGRLLPAAAFLDAHDVAVVIAPDHLLGNHGAACPGVAMTVLVFVVTLVVAVVVSDDDSAVGR
mgnify:CR=1 FL=1